LEDLVNLFENQLNTSWMTLEAAFCGVALWSRPLDQVHPRHRLTWRYNDANFTGDRPD
jgi:hypothetical protein